MKISKKKRKLRKDKPEPVKDKKTFLKRSTKGLTEADVNAYLKSVDKIEFSEEEKDVIGSYRTKLDELRVIIGNQAIDIFGFIQDFLQTTGQMQEAGKAFFDRHNVQAYDKEANWRIDFENGCITKVKESQKQKEG